MCELNRNRVKRAIERAVKVIDSLDLAREVENWEEVEDARKAILVTYVLLTVEDAKQFSIDAVELEISCSDITDKHKKEIKKFLCDTIEHLKDGEQTSGLEERLLDFIEEVLMKGEE